VQKDFFNSIGQNQNPSSALACQLPPGADMVGEIDVLRMAEAGSVVERASGA
jgi:hypothetical protein